MSGNKLFKCDSCDKSFDFSSSLSRHKKNEHNLLIKVPTISCLRCADKPQFYYLNQLINHVQDDHKIQMERVELNFDNEKGEGDES